MQTPKVATQERAARDRPLRAMLRSPARLIASALLTSVVRLLAGGEHSGRVTVRKHR
jgi:hypothetical protein